MLACEMAQRAVARRYFVRGRVQGVGYRYFVQRQAVTLGLTGFTRNLDNGQVEVFAVGKAEKLAELEGWLWKGPAFSDVRGVEAKEDVVERFSTFQIER